MYIVLKDEGSVLWVNELGVIMFFMLKFINNILIFIDVNKEDICVIDKNVKVIVYEKNWFLYIFYNRCVSNFCVFICDIDIFFVNIYGYWSVVGEF